MIIVLSISSPEEAVAKLLIGPLKSCLKTTVTPSFTSITGTGFVIHIRTSSKSGSTYVDFQPTLDWGMLAKSAIVTGLGVDRSPFSTPVALQIAFLWQTWKHCREFTWWSTGVRSTGPSFSENAEAILTRFPGVTMSELREAGIWRG